MPLPTEADYHLEPQTGPLSKLICDRCDKEIGEVYTASQTLTGKQAGMSTEELHQTIHDLVRDHLEQEHQGEPDKGADYVNRSPLRSPEGAPMKKGGRGEP